MKYIFWAILIFLSFILQGRVSILGVPPNLTALLVYYAGVKYGQTKGLLTGVLIGALEDNISSPILGPNLLAKATIGYFSSLFITGGFFRWTPVLGIFALFLLTLLDNSIVFISRSLFDKIPAELTSALFVSIMQSILNAPAGIFIRPKNAE